jgi:myosin-5
MAHLYDVGTRAWLPHPEEEWIASQVTAKNVTGDKVRLVFQLDSGEVHTLELTYPSFILTVYSPTLLQTKTIETTLQTLENDPDGTLPPLMNPSMLEASDDLTNLSHLNEPAGTCSILWKT